MKNIAILSLMAATCVRAYYLPKVNAKSFSLRDEQVNNFAKDDLSNLIPIIECQGSKFRRDV